MLSSPPSQTFDVSLARNGVEAVEKAAEWEPHVILMDVQMPEMDGLEATRRIRSIDKLARTPIIGLTGLASSIDQRNCIDAGMNVHMSKPFEL